MANNRRPVFVSLLPATPCTPEMREELTKVADENNISMAEVLRRAFALFLQGNDSKTIYNDSETIQEAATPQTT